MTSQIYKIYFFQIFDYLCPPQQTVKAREYIIEFQKLQKGVNHYTFAIDDKLLESVGSEYLGKIKAVFEAELIKTGSMYEIKFELSGQLKTECDVCLDEFELLLKGNFTLILKVSETENLSDDEIVFIKPDAIDYDVSGFIYDSLVISIPVKKTCELIDKKCNDNILKILNTFEHDNKKEEQDPRWDKLKDILKEK